MRHYGVLRKAVNATRGVYEIMHGVRYRVVSVIPLHKVTSPLGGDAMTFLSIHHSAVLRGDGLLPELAALFERPIPRMAEPVDVLPNSETSLKNGSAAPPAGLPIIS